MLSVGEGAALDQADEGLLLGCGVGYFLGRKASAPTNVAPNPLEVTSFEPAGGRSLGDDGFVGLASFGAAGGCGRAADERAVSVGVVGLCAIVLCCFLDRIGGGLVLGHDMDADAVAVRFQCMLPTTPRRNSS
jgi:hypothetical protein